MADPANSVAVATGSLTVSGSLTSFIAAEGDLFLAGGLIAEISSRESGTQLTLKQPWAGATLQGATTWSILSLGPYWRSAISTNKQLAELIGKWDAGPVKWDASGTYAQRSQYDNQPNDFVFLAVDPLPWRLYVKQANTNSASDWSLGQILGDRGPVAFEEAIAEVNTQVANKLDITGDSSTTTVQVDGFPTPRLIRDWGNDYITLAMARNEKGGSAAPAAAALNYGCDWLAQRGGGILNIARNDSSGNNDTIDLAAGSWTHKTANVRVVGEGRTRFVSTLANGPIIILGEQNVSHAYTLLEACEVWCNAPVRTGALIQIWNQYFGGLRHVRGGLVDGSGLPDDGICADGGSNSYGTILDDILMNYCRRGLVLGEKARLVNIFLRTFEFGSCRLAGINLKDLDGLLIDEGEVLQSQNFGFLVNPDGGQGVTTVRCGIRVFVDTCAGPGLDIRQGVTPGGRVHELILPLRISANGYGNSTGTPVSPGTRINGSGLTLCELINFSGGRISGSGLSGADISYAHNIIAHGADASGNGVGNAGSGAAGACGWGFGQGVRGASIQGGRAAGKFASDSGQYQTYGANIYGDADYISIGGMIDMSGNLGVPLTASSVGTHNVYGDIQRSFT